MDGVLPTRRVGRRAEVGDRATVGQGHEGVPKALADVHRATLDVVEQHALPGPERWRADPKVDHDVEDGADKTRHVLRLARWDLREVDPPNHASGGHGAVGLRERQGMPDRVAEAVSLEPFEEHAAVVSMLQRRDLEGARDGERADLHGRRV